MENRLFAVKAPYEMLDCCFLFASRLLAAGQWYIGVGQLVDGGTVINEALARVQAEGGIAQGIGHALYEIVEHDERGRLRTGNFMSYKLPTRLDIGSIRVAFEPSYEPTGPFGAKSIGEVVINTPLAAVASAVAHATGHQVRSLPITPEKALLGE